MNNNLTYKLNVETKNFYRIDNETGEYEVWIWKGFDEEFKSVTKGDAKGGKKIVAWIRRLSDRIPTQPEKAKPLEGQMCKTFSVWELKPKPYRVSFVCLCNKYIVVGTVWRKRANSRDSAEIERACRLMSKLVDLFLKEVKQCC